MSEDTYVSGQFIDITAPGVLEIKIRRDGKVVWINVDGICRFRACQIETLILEDDRNAVDSASPESNT